MKRSWVEADFFCQALGAQLASIIHYEEEVFLKELLGTMFERWYFLPEARHCKVMGNETLSCLGCDDGLSPGKNTIVRKETLLYIFLTIGLKELL